MLNYYTGYKPGDTPGNLPPPYYWWEAGAMFSSLVDYWYYTGDTQFNDITTQALLHQVGPNNDYMPPNQTKTLGNDDQAFWGMAAMTAAEVNYPNPPQDQPQWLALAQAVFNTQVPRWDPDTCGGGLRWQIFPFNNGYNYKNTISNGCFFNLGARLAKFTGNMTYADQAEKAWDWMFAIGLISPDYHFYDGSDSKINCTDTNHIQWTYNAGINLYGAASMWNITQSDKWRTRVQGIIDGLGVFFYQDTKIMFEVACEPNGKCDVDQRSFKAYLSRWIAATTKVAPWTHEVLMPYVQASAKAAAAQCTGGTDGQQCGMLWYQGGFDGSLGVGEQMSALEVVQSLLIDQVGGPFSSDNGGTSRGDPTAGTGNPEIPKEFSQITAGDKVGAGFLTTIVLVALLGGSWWVIS